MKLKTEARVTYNAIGQPDWINPRGRIAKQMEGSIKRAAALDRLISAYVSAVGVEKARQHPPQRGSIPPPRDDRRIKDPAERLAEAAFPPGNNWSDDRSMPDEKSKAATWQTPGGLRHPVLRSVELWQWVYDLWMTGGLRRSMEALSEMLPAENARRVEQLTLGD